MSFTITDRAFEVLDLSRFVVSHDVETRRAGGDWVVDRTDNGALVKDQQIVLGQLCLWAWSIEQDTDASERLELAVDRCSWIIPPSQALGFARALCHPSRPAPDESSRTNIDDLRARYPGTEPRLLEAVQCDRAVDLARGITSTLARERLHATRLAADAVASRSLTDDEARCFAGLLSYALVVESDAEVRREQATVLAIAAHHGRLAEAHRQVAWAADLTEEERTALDGG